MTEKSAAILVTFNPDNLVFKRLHVLSKQIDYIFVVDNSKNSPSPNILPSNAELITNGNAGGLAGALNIGLKRARQESIDYLFIFDQDTDPPADFCTKLLIESKNFSDSCFGIFGPMHINSSTGYAVRLSVPNRFMNSAWPKTSNKFLECLFLINSGTLLDLKRIPPNLKYDEDLAVDMTDVDFCLTARLNGIKSICLTNIQVIHGIGNRIKGSSRFSPTNYQAPRKYLQTRNKIIIWKRFFHTEPGFVVSDFFIWNIDVIRTILCERDKLSKLRAIIKGIINGTSFFKYAKAPLDD